jgi:hypothetical protein
MTQNEPNEAAAAPPVAQVADQPATVPPEIMAAIQSGPAPYANRMYATLIIPAGLRLTFMERSEDGVEHFRTAVFLSVTDIIELRGLLDRMLQNVEIKLTEIPKGAADAEGVPEGGTS